MQTYCHDAPRMRAQTGGHRLQQMDYTQSATILPGCRSSKERRERPVLIDDSAGLRVPTLNFATCSMSVLYAIIVLLIYVY
jgi:hypothetical protein